ncbi:hypothetical protein PPO43_00555 [Saprospira sp. CCB-QB6]|uniref:hypothetical protein n=1 Tax=Saprospira sp. CCB-QB6 TaxID=3023936 RepID=UPI00234989AA|nr:hypothetical protein [Saprospira sp. CCB-QB6]WCL81585.1 hypothetical protein PPO43_00555 [Saprospira sp. CCB-QB6]
MEFLNVQYKSLIRANNGRAHRAGIIFSFGADYNVTNIDKEENIVFFDSSIEFNYGGKWSGAISSGVEYFSKKFFLERNEYNEFWFEVVDISWYQIDTNFNIMMYTTIMALCKETGILISDLEFNEETGTLILPHI